MTTAQLELTDTVEKEYLPFLHFSAEDSDECLKACNFGSCD